MRLWGRLKQGKFFPYTLKHRALKPSEIRALDFKGEFPRFGIGAVSATIGTDRFSTFFNYNCAIYPDRKKTVASRRPAARTHAFAFSVMVSSSYVRETCAEPRGAWESSFLE